MTGRAVSDDTIHIKVLRGTAVNGIAWAYDSWGNVAASYQNHAAAASTSDPSVQYAYAKPGDTGSGNSDSVSVRLSKVTYPNGREVFYNYASAGSIGDVLNRIDNIAASATPANADIFARYAYLGAGTIVRVSRPSQADGLALDYDPDANNTYAGWDRFGRVVNQQWTTTGGTIDQYTYEYDIAGNRTTRTNALNAALTETYTYDELSRLIDADRGEGQQQVNFESWNLDQLGNWTSFCGPIQDPNNPQTRLHNEANEITSIDNSSAQVAYDAAGNMIRMPSALNQTQTHHAVYDAWNRMTAIYLDDGDGTFEPGAGDWRIGAYQYDGQRRRIVTTAGNETRDVYFNESWQVVEERERGFGGDGIVTTGTGPTTSDCWTNVSVQPDGKIVTAGRMENGSQMDASVGRYNPDGSLDTTFSGDGIASIGIPSSNDGVNSIAFQPDGKIVVAGYVEGPTRFFVARLNPDGTLDTSFSGDGQLVLQLNSNDYAASVSVLSDGKILVGGWSSGDFAVVRLTSAGELDTTFGDQGKALVDFGGSEYGYNMAVDSQGRIVLAGYAWSGGNRVMAAARLTSEGALDTTFDSDGKQTVSFGGTTDVANVLAIAPDDKIVLGGYTSTGSQATFAVARLTTSGTLDTTFDSDGRQTASFGGADVALAIAVQPDGKVILAGYNRTSPTTSDFEVARFTAGGALDATFSGDGIQTVDFAPQGAAATGVAVQADGKIVLAGPSESSGFDYGLARLRADGSLDTGSRTQYVMDLRYVDSVAVRFYDANADGDYGDEGDNVLYYTDDANFNVTALVSANTGDVVERNTFASYGKPEFRTPDWTVISASTVDNRILMSGYRLNPETGTYDVRNRVYDPVMGSFVTKDPIQEESNYYLYCFSNPLAMNDPTGLMGEDCVYTGRADVPEPTLKDEALVRADAPLEWNKDTLKRSTYVCKCEATCCRYEWRIVWHPIYIRSEVGLYQIGEYPTLEQRRSAYVAWPETGDIFVGHASYADFVKEMAFIEQESSKWIAGELFKVMQGDSLPKSPDRGGEPKVPDPEVKGWAEIAKTMAGIMGKTSGRERALKTPEDIWKALREIQVLAFRAKCEKTCAARKGQKS